MALTFRSLSNPRGLALALALLTLLLYLPTRRFDFVNFDDPAYVAENRAVEAGLTWSGIQWAFTTTHASNWHPLTWMSHMLDCQLWGPKPAGHHLVNALIHAANAALLLLLLSNLTGAVWPAAIVAALFAWHPLHVESVAWISERKDLLSAFFGLLCLRAYLRYARPSSGAESKGLSMEDGRPSSILNPPSSIPRRVEAKHGPPHPLAGRSEAKTAPLSITCWPWSSSRWDCSASPCS